MRILVVCDDQAMLDSLETLVRRWGHRVLALRFPARPKLSESALELFEKAAVFGPEVVLVRRVMPGWDALALADEIEFGVPWITGGVFPRKLIFLGEMDSVRRGIPARPHYIHPIDRSQLPLPFEPTVLKKVIERPRKLRRQRKSRRRTIEVLTARGIPADKARELAKPIADDGSIRQPLPVRRELRLPDDANLLEETNLTPALAAALAGQTVTVSVFPEQGTFDPKLDTWYVPPRVFYADDSGRVWQFPRRWLPEHRSASEALSEPPLMLHYEVTQERVQEEWLRLPPKEDLEEINLPRIGGNPVQVEVHYRPNEPVRVFWPERYWGGPGWRIPNAWRKRRIRLPSLEILVAQGIPLDVADECCGKIVSVNYHPGSLCCLREHYRFYDRDGQKWPVRIADCTVVGLGNESESAA